MGRKGKSKGSQFERDLCTQLSRWWTGDQRDDVFWRSTISGGRATVRGRKQKTTSGQYGDIQAVDPIGLPLLKVLTIEAKCGYRGVSFGDLLDASDKQKPIWEEWISQVETAWGLSKSFSWMLVVKRDRRTILAVFPTSFYQVLCGYCDGVPRIRPIFKVRLPVRSSRASTALVAMPLRSLLSTLRSREIREIAEDYCVKKECRCGG